jgi:hypothetical protein
MLFWQNRSFGILSINPRALVQDSTGALQLGVGIIIQRHDYISTQVGCKHQWGILNQENHIWYDTNTKIL